MLRSWFLAGLLAFVTVVGGYAQSQSNTANLRGVVQDPSGAVVPGVSVTTTNVATGLERNSVTDDEGNFQLLLLPPGEYEVRAEMPGFGTKVVQGIKLTVGQYAEIVIDLVVSTQDTAITVSGSTEIVERQKTVQASTIEEQQIENLPINGRSYLDFSLLTPGSTTKNSLVNFSAPQTPSSGISFGGQDMRSNYVTIDGADNVDVVSNGVRATMSQAAIQEFQISRNSFSAEFGRARGGVINIVSKSGTNAFHGSGFFFFRNNALDARNAFARLEDPPFKRYEYGGTLGGPIVRDRTFFFGSFERLDRHESNFVTFLDNPSIFQATSSQNALFGFLGAVGDPKLAALSAAFINPQVGILNTTKLNFPGTLNLFENESGIFPFRADQNLFSVKLDHRFSDNNDFFTRVSYSNSFNDGADFGALQGVSNGMSFDTRDFSLVFSDSHIFSPNTLNDAKFQYGDRKFKAMTNDPNGPEIILAGVAQFGREFFNPSGYDQRLFQVTDAATFIRGNHTLKAGADVNLLNIGGYAEVFLGGQFSFGEAIPLGLIIDQAGGTGTTQTVATLLGTPQSAGGLGRPDLIPNLTEPITSVQSYNLGLPITYFQGFGDPTTDINYTQMALFLQDTWRVSNTFTLNLGVRYDTDWRPETLNVISSESAPFTLDRFAVTDHNNFAPRVGLAWNPDGTGGTVIRAGYGIFYQNFFQAIAFVSQVLSGQISQVFLPLTGLPGISATSREVYGAFRAAGKIDESVLASLGLQPGTTPSVILPGAANVQNPYSHQASFGIERRLARDWALSLDYMLNRGLGLIRSRDVNVRQIGDNLFTLPGLDPRYVQVNMIETSGSSIYHGFTASLKKRFSQSYSVSGSYTFGKGIDDTTDFITQLQPNNQRDLRAERSLSSFDQRQRFVISGIYQSPHSPMIDNGFVRNLLADWTMAPIVTIGSGRPFNLLLGFDANEDTHEETDRPVTSSGGNVGRNTGTGPAYVTTDLRISRRLPLAQESVAVDLIFEAFNLFNNVNYSGVNNVIGTTVINSGHVTGSSDVASNRPFGFTSAFDPRQIQFGFRLTF